VGGDEERGEGSVRERFNALQYRRTYVSLSQKLRVKRRGWALLTSSAQYSRSDLTSASTELGYVSVTEPFVKVSQVVLSTKSSGSITMVVVPL
jgi:hypothetical protein